MPKIRILYAIDSVEENAGPDKQLAEMITHIDKSRFDVHLCCVRDCPQMHGLAEHCKTALFPMGSIYRPNGIRQILRLRRYINEHDIDVIQTFMVKANILGVMAARKSKCKVILSSRRNTNYWFTPFYARLYRYMNKYTTRIVANAGQVKKVVIETEGVPPDMVDVLYNGVDMTKYAPGLGDPSVPRSLGIPDDVKLVGIVANFRPVKDHPLFLHAAKLVAESAPDAAFVLVGTGPLRNELGCLVDELGLGEKVFFTDGAGAVQAYLDRMCIGSLSSKTEGFSNAILEYMATGVPAVATAVGGNCEAIEHNVTGYTVPRDPAALAEPIIELLGDDTKRDEMGRRSLERCRETFEIGAAIRRYEDYYAALVEGAQK